MNYADIYPEYIGEWNAFTPLGTAYPHAVVLIINDDGSSSWSTSKGGTEKPKVKKGRFKITDNEVLRVGRKCFDITREPTYNTVTDSWFLQLDSVTYYEVKPI